MLFLIFCFQVGRSAVFSLGGGAYSSHQQQQQHAPISGGGSYLPANAQDLHFHGSEVVYTLITSLFYCSDALFISHVASMEYIFMNGGYVFISSVSNWQIKKLNLQRNV